MAFSTRIKLQINELLNPVGLQIRTTLAEEVEKSRIEKLESSGHWEIARYDQGIEFSPETYLKFLRETCPPFRAQFEQFPKHTSEAGSFYLENGYFQSVDAELLYSIVRSYRPRHVIEIGSGFSTHLISLALAAEQLSTTLTSIDPNPRVPVTSCVTRHIQMKAEESDPEFIINTLESADVLFIDSSHHVVTGGDVPFLFLEILPRLKAGVLVHIHDIFLPFDYPKEWKLQGWNWNEQYLVHAFLAFNNSFRILWPARYMWEYYRNEIMEIIPADSLSFPPSSLWLIRT